MAMEAAERYYEKFGPTWENAAYIKARTRAGDLAAGSVSVGPVAPLSGAGILDFAAIQDCA